MYTPRLNRVDDLPTMQDFMQAFNFALLVTIQDNRPVATALPFMLDRERGKYGTLIAHIARANPQWKHFADGSEVLVIFQGHDSYVSPYWYSTHPSVPTWNYMTVHAYGVPHIVEGESAMLEVLRRLVDHHESEYPEPWRMEDMPPDYQDSNLKAIVAFEIEITQLEGKFKLSQNRSVEDQTGVIEGLSASPRPNEVAIANEMKQRFQAP